MTDGRAGVSEFKHRYVTLFGRRFGLEYSVAGVKYLQRYILYFGWGTLRLHCFLKGDDARAPHDHPWSFITFPFRGYWETYFAQESDIHNEELHWVERVRWVKPWRFHHRHALHRHIVHMSHPGFRSHFRVTPFWTFVVTGEPARHGRSAAWGFYPTPEQFVSYKDWEQYCQDNNL